MTCPRNPVQRMREYETENEYGKNGVKKNGICAEQVIGKLSEAVVLLGHQNTVSDVISKIKVTILRQSQGFT